MKEHDHFDEVIKAKLNEYAVPLADGAWDIFEKKQREFLSGEQLEDEILDQKAASLDGFEIPFNRRHWSLMAKRIQKELVFIRELTHLKAMEISLMVLMLLFFWQQLPMPKGEQNPVYQQQPEPIAEQMQPSSTTTKETKQPKIHEDENEVNYNRSTAMVVPSVNGISGAISTPFLQGKEEGVNAIPDIVPTLPKQILIPPVPEEQLLPRPPANQIDVLDPQPIAFSGTELATTYHAVKKKTLFKVGMFGGTERNIIIMNTANVPTDEPITSRIYHQLDAGYSGGVSLGIARGRFEYHLKLLYTAIRYQPIDVINVAGSIEKSYVGKKYAEFEFNTFQIPIAFRYNIVDRNHWKLFTDMGIAWHLVGQSFYHQQEKQYNEDEEARRGISQRAQYLNPVGYEYAYPGFFQKGGAFLTNSYITGNVGFGIERSFGGKWSAFIASRYAHSLYNFNGGLGPYKDNIHSLSFESGIIVTMMR